MDVKLADTIQTAMQAGGERIPIGVGLFEVLFLALLASLHLHPDFFVPIAQQGVVQPIQMLALRRSKL